MVDFFIVGFLIFKLAVGCDGMHLKPIYKYFTMLTTGGRPLFTDMLNKPPQF
jgi:hypothetical protein